ncbi:MAG: TonB C-terminal domain-containing protein [Campylobacterota bacterium]|nr:TonB C-terminal domain-containing protein [Campylobacterota bacterium]
MMFSSNGVKSYALKKDNYISVSINMSNLNTKSYKKNISKKKNENVVTTPKEVNIDNLFSDVWTKKIDKKTIKKKKSDIRQLHEIEKKVKTIQNNDLSEISDKINKIQASTQSDENIPSSTSNEVNEYFAKIQALVYNSFKPPQNSQGHSVKAVIELSAIGKVMDFRILNYSVNSSLNDECDKIKARLMGVIFPMNPQNRSSYHTIILISEE